MTLHTSSDEAEKGFYKCIARTILEATLHMSSVEVSELRTSSDEAEKGFYKRIAQTILEVTLHMLSVEVSDDSSIAMLRQFCRRRCIRHLMRLKKDFTNALLRQYWK